MKVYIIKEEEMYNNGSKCYSGICGVYNTLNKAKKILEEIKEQEMCDFDEDLFDNIENGFYIDLGNDYNKYEIIEMEVE